MKTALLFLLFSLGALVAGSSYADVRVTYDYASHSVVIPEPPVCTDLKPAILALDTEFNDVVCDDGNALFYHALLILKRADGSQSYAEITAIEATTAPPPAPPASAASAPAAAASSASTTVTDGNLLIQLIAGLAVLFAGFLGFRSGGFA